MHMFRYVFSRDYPNAIDVTPVWESIKNIQYRNILTDLKKELDLLRSSSIVDENIKLKINRSSTQIETLIQRLKEKENL